MLYPFNGSIYNNAATVGFQDDILPYIDQAFLISVLGYFSVWMGRYLFDVTQREFPTDPFIPTGKTDCSAGGK